MFTSQTSLLELRAWMGKTIMLLMLMLLVVMMMMMMMMMMKMQTMLTRHPMFTCQTSLLEHWHGCKDNDGDDDEEGDRDFAASAADDQVKF